MILFAAFALAGCLALPPGAENITAADLHLDGVPPETKLSFAPAPGAARVFPVSELRQIAARFHLTELPENEICVERVTAQLDPVKLLAVMQETLPAAKIEISDFSKQPAPQGDIEFRRGGLRNNGVAGAIWFGAIRFAPNREFTIWAKVRVTIHAARVIAVGDLNPGNPIAAGQVKLEMRDEFPAALPLAETIEEAVGRYPRTAIRAGAEIRRDAFEAAKDVRVGDIVEVDVQNGAAHLKFEARAEGSGSIGETVAICNPTSSKRFIAKIEAKGKVSVDVKVIP